MLKFSEIFEFSGENSYFERIRMVRMVRMVRSLADRTFQPRYAGRGEEKVKLDPKLYGADELDRFLRSPLAEPSVPSLVPSSVERFDRRGTEPNELFTADFGQNSSKIQEFSLEN